MTDIESPEVLTIEPKDRPLNPYRLPKSENVIALVKDVMGQMIAYENYFELRKRKRRSSDHKRFEDIVTAIICDLIYASLCTPDKKLYVSLSKRIEDKIKRYSPASFGDTLPDLLKVLSSKELSFVEMKKGQQGYFGTARQTTIKAGKRLISRIEHFDIEPSDLRQDINQESIILKKSKEGFWDNGEWVDYVDNETTNQYRHQMKLINEWLANADIGCEPLDDDNPIDESDRMLKRIFNNGSFESGGRLFGGFWQGLKKTDRKSLITINGQSITTLDFSQTAPRIAYSMVGVVPPLADAYAIPFYSTPKNRKSVKQVFNALLYSDKPLTRFPKGTRDGFEKDISFNTLLTKINETHRPIAPLFGTGTGLKIMFIESQVLIKALLECMNKNIVALPVHDALIVAKSDFETTKEIMLRAFRDITGMDGQVEEE